MATKNIDDVVAGRDLDARMAILAGWRWIDNSFDPTDAYLIPPDEAAKYLPERISTTPPEGWRGGRDWHSDLPHYSTDKAAAGDILAKVREWNDIQRADFLLHLKWAVEDRVDMAVTDRALILYAEPIDICRAVVRCDAPSADS